MIQKIIAAENNYKDFDTWVRETGAKKILLVCDGSIMYLEKLNKHLEEIEKMSVKIIRFQDFQPNPLYESVVKGVELFHEEACDAIIVIGGGSAMDVAKCIKAYSKMDSSMNYLEQEIVPNGIPFLAIPTTAGTGSEATRYAVIYYKGIKQSVTSENFIPDTVLFDPTTLRTLPIYQKKATMMDALCHAIESFWSVNSTEESKIYSRKAIELILENLDGYLSNTDEGNAGMLKAANIAGKAINITQTTAGHAMCYKITSLFKAAHGHAAILCDRVLFPWMLKNMDKCIDPRGQEYFKKTLEEIAATMGCDSPKEAAQELNDIFTSLGFDVPAATEAEYEELKTSVNPVRLKNHPIALDEETIDKLYHQILR